MYTLEWKHFFLAMLFLGFNNFVYGLLCLFINIVWNMWTRVGELWLKTILIFLEKHFLKKPLQFYFILAFCWKAAFLS